MPIQSVLSGQQTKGLSGFLVLQKKHDLFRVDLVSGSGRVSGSGQCEQLSKVYSGQLVGDFSQAFDTRSLYNLFPNIEHCVANHQVTYRKMCLKKTVHFNMQDVLGAGQQSQSLEM